MLRHFAWILAALLVAACVPKEPAPVVWSSPEAEVEAYLDAEYEEYRELAERMGWNPPHVPKRLAVAATVRMIPNPLLHGDDTAAVREAVEILNDHLPATIQLEFDDTTEWWYDQGRRWRENPRSILRGSILVGFLPREVWPPFPGVQKVAAAALPFHADPKNGRHLILGGVIAIDPERADAMDVPMTAIVLHELLHVLGRKHPESGHFPDTLMRHDRPVRDEYPYLRPLDIRVMQAVYGKR